MRNTTFAAGEYYHVYNRGVDKRNIFKDKEDVVRFLLCLQIFNSVENSRSILESTLKKKGGIPNFGSSAPKKKAVSIIAYCLNQNHFHIIVKPLSDEGLQKFMHRLATGYTNYFNEKNKRSGSLFEGRYKAKHIISNEYLLHLSAYVNLNDQVHRGMNKSWMKQLSFSSFDEYVEKRKNGICDKDIILEQFKNIKSFATYCQSVLPVLGIWRNFSILLKRNN